MAEFMIGPLVSLLKDKASSYLLDKYKVMRGMEGQREILERRLQAIQDIIEDAEKGASRAGVSAWLQRLKKVSYEAIDVFDEFKYEELRRDAVKKGHHRKLGVDVVSLFPARNPIVFRYRMSKKLHKILQNIEVLVKEMNDFRFTQRQQIPPPVQWRQTDSIMVDSERDIVSRSRNEEKKKIVKVLLEQEEDIMVLPIIGVGGLGKTTFVQLIYNDPEVKKHFNLLRWCCVSEDFDIVNIARDICQRHEENREKALQDLQKELSGKRYLIVLDDVWNQDAEKWGKLMTCLKQGEMGSAILTTTRDAEVARVMIMGAPGSYYLQKLGNRYMKEIIENRAFSVQKPNSDELDEIVDKIVDRCVGSPLAAKAFGSMMSSKTSIQEWKDILAKSNIWNEKTDIFPILKLSYDDLPSNMKQCFAFCAVFPKDYEIDVESLIQLWMAHDFIPAQQEENPDMVGKAIFNQLAWRSFFQDVKQTPAPLDYYGKRKQLRNGKICKIHDLMHDVALSIMGNECATIADRPNKKSLSNPTRHMFISYQETRTLLDDFLKKQSSNLHTLLYSHPYIYGSTPHLSKYNSLRSIQLCQLEKLPIRPRYLQHLRYLNLSENWRIEELPQEISVLYNLLTMDLSHCSSLCRLPNDMKYMRSLRHLYTNGCSSLECMPPDLGQLTSLQTLTYFVVGSSSDCSTIGELQNISLGGELDLNGLENATEEHAKAASLGNKENITHLSLKWSSEGQEELVQDYHNKVLDALKPHGGLEMLRILNYKGCRMSTWVQDLSLFQQHLTELHIVGCTMCEDFPEFSHLRALQVLHLEKLYKLQSLCSDMAFMEFPALKKLKLHNLKSMDSWVATNGKGEELTFPVLEEFDIINCPKLRNLPEAPNIKVMRIKEDKAQLLISLISSKYLSSLSLLVLSVSDTEATLPLAENHELSTEEMKIIGCSFFFASSPPQQIVGIWKWFGQLQALEIHNCSSVIYWPEEEFLSLVSLTKLHIVCCSNLFGRAQVNGVATPARVRLLPKLKKLEIDDCARLTELFVLPPSVTEIHIDGCSSFQFIWGKYGTELMGVQVEHGNDPTLVSPCLETLFIRGSDKLEGLSNLPQSLKKLSIYHCPELRSISGHLEGLLEVGIGCCHKLESPDWGNMPALEGLGLLECKRLTTLPGSLGNYSALIRVHVAYCPAINMKPLYEHLPQRLDSLEYKLLSRVRSSDPGEGPKLQDPKSWIYAIPGCKNWAIRRYLNS
ncbi:unnamed protein product [Urochloa humidicola]